MEEQESSAPNFIPKDLLDIICILERDERHHSYKIVRNRTGFSLIAKFGAKNVETTPLKNNASAKTTARYQDKKQVSSEDKLTLQEMCCGFLLSREMWYRKSVLPGTGAG